MMTVNTFLSDDEMLILSYYMGEDREKTLQSMEEGLSDMQAEENKDEEMIFVMTHLISRLREMTEEEYGSLDPAFSVDWDEGDLL